MEKFIMVDGVSFEVEKVSSETFERMATKNLLRLTECYNRPSTAKINIFAMWEKFFYEKGIDLCNRGVAGYNSMIFTYMAKSEDTIYYITPCHNRMYVKE